jgi:hypothetical protein
MLCLLRIFTDHGGENEEMAAFWDTAPCSLVEVDRRFRGAIDLMMELVRTSETPAYFKETTQLYIL